MVYFCILLTQFVLFRLNVAMVIIQTLQPINVKSVLLFVQNVLEQEIKDVLSVLRVQVLFMTHSQIHVILNVLQELLLII